MSEKTPRVTKKDIMRQVDAAKRNGDKVVPGLVVVVHPTDPEQHSRKRQPQGTTKKGRFLQI